MSTDHTSNSTSSKRQVLAVASIAGCSFLTSLFNGALTVSLPTIQRDLNISAANLQWSVSLYALILGAFLLPMGRLADIYGPKKLFLGGTAAFTAFSLCIALSPHWIAFTSFCTLLALGAAANTPSGAGVIGALFFDAGEARNRAFAVLGAGQPLGFIVGLVLGAVLTQTKSGWRTTFYVQAALAGLFGILGFFSIPHTLVENPQHSSAIALDEIGEEHRPVLADREVNRRLDWIGTALSVIGLVLLTFSLADAQAEPKGWRTPFLPPLIPIALITLAAFFFWEKRLEEMGIAYYATPDVQGPPPPPPLLSPSLWQAPHFAQILAIVFFAWASFNTSSYYINLIMQSVLLVSPLKSALYYLPMIISGTILNLVPGFLLGRISGKLLICISMALGLVGPLLIAIIDIRRSYWSYIFPTMLFLPGPDLCYAIAQVHISKSLPRSEQATAGALFNVVTRLATAISLGLISTGATTTSANYIQDHSRDATTGLANTAESPAVLLAGYRVAGWACFACAVVGLFLAVGGLRGIGIVGRKEDPQVDEGNAESSTQGNLIRRRARRTSTT